MEIFNITDIAVGEYELLSKIKTSGNSELFLLYDRICGRKVLMKSGKTDMIENEARLMSKLSGKGIPEVYSCFEKDGKAYLFRQYIEGKSLHERIVSDRAFSQKETIKIGIEICEIISKLHCSDPPIIHRDIKSDNIIITDDGEIFIIDLGISREYDPAASRDTQVMGTPLNAPPEQFGYGQTDERSDVYALGVLLCELVTGSESSDLSELPHELAPIIKRCTEFAPDKRYRNAAECKYALLKKQKNPHKAVPLIVSVCAVAAAVFILSFNGRKENIPDTSVTENEKIEAVQADDTEPSADIAYNANDDELFIELDSEYPGDFEYSSLIPKKYLDAFDGDVTVELEVETIDEGSGGNYHSLAPVNANDRWEKLTVSSLHERGDDGTWLIVGKGQDSCKFTVSRETIETLGDDGIVFQIYNLIIKSASIRKADEEAVNEYEQVIDTKTLYTVELNDEYQGDYALSKTIPKSVLESYEGDIKITLDIETGGLYNYANFIPIALVGDNAEWRNLVEEIECEYTRNGDGFIDVQKDQTECTLILSHDAVEMLGKHGIGFQAVNMTVKSASLIDAD
ncbi:MAG: serine/threonine protein kinase, partial [Oscillospiraceae bacterium]